MNSETEVPGHSIPSFGIQMTSPRSHSPIDGAPKDDSRNERRKSYHFTGLYILGNNIICQLRADTKELGQIQAPPFTSHVIWGS